MTLAEILGWAAGLGVEAARSEAARHGVTIPPELAAEAAQELASLFVRGPGVTHAEHLVVDDQRTPAA